jgi:hypothetical protein
VASAAGSRSLIALSAPISVSERTDLALPGPDIRLIVHCPFVAGAMEGLRAWQKLTAS